MEALIKPWRASGPSAPCWSMPASFCRKKPWVQCWAFSGFRGCEGPQPSKVRKDHWSFDQDLEGVRSLGAVLVDASFVLPQQGMGPMLGLYWFPRLQGTAALQVNVVFQGGMASAFAKASADTSVPSQFSSCLLEGLTDLWDGTESVP